ncbi:MAG: nicotinic acid mononucleotide adenylyltransferase [Gammaproteobacteria bacterium]|nr:MAG: nicotinic acid mononucleotide adenylyltransferase [Gammaproteobacteria bacterium]
MLGYFGGTFDPVHYGHLRPAIELAEAYRLDTLSLLPNHRPAHRGPTGATSADRIRMLELAVADVPRLIVDAREAERDAPSYTVDTLHELHEEDPLVTLVFFLGIDAFAHFDTWSRWEEILRLANLVVIERPEAEHSRFSRNLLRRQQARHGKRIERGRRGVIVEQAVTQLEISATDLRHRLAAGLSIRFLLPEAVREYIDEHGLYR